MQPIKPFTQWYCDRCGKLIESTSKGYVVWQSHDDETYSDFTVIHKTICDNDDRFIASQPISHFRGPSGRSTLLSYLSLGPLLTTKPKSRNVVRIRDMDSFVDFFRRMQVPYYEQARRRFELSEVKSKFGGDPGYTYSPEVLQEIIALR